MSTSTWQTETSVPRASQARLWAGRIMGGVPAALLLVDALMKIARTPTAVDMTVQLGYPAATVLPIGVALLVSVVLYLVPQTSVFGAVLLTGYLGGAVASHVRAGQGVEVFWLPIAVCALLWFGLRFCEPRLASITPRRWTV